MIFHEEEKQVQQHFTHFLETCYVASNLNNNTFGYFSCLFLYILNGMLNKRLCTICFLIHVLNFHIFEKKIDDKKLIFLASSNALAPPVSNRLIFFYILRNVYKLNIFVLRVFNVLISLNKGFKWYKLSVLDLI